MSTSLVYHSAFGAQRDKALGACIHREYDAELDVAVARFGVLDPERSRQHRIVSAMRNQIRTYALRPHRREIDVDGVYVDQSPENKLEVVAGSAQTPNGPP